MARDEAGYWGVWNLKIAPQYYYELDALVINMFPQSAVFIYNSCLVLGLWSWPLAATIFCLEVALYPRAHRMTSLLLGLAKLTFCLQYNLTQLKKNNNGQNINKNNSRLYSTVCLFCPGWKWPNPKPLCWFTYFGASWVMLDLAGKLSVSLCP